MSAPLRVLGWVAVGGLLWPWGGAPGRGAEPFAGRLLGPVAGLAASAQWVRFDLFLREGRYGRAYACAEQALTLDPRAPQGWVTYASHLAYFRGSAQNEPDPEARRRWIRAGIELLERGEKRTSDPAELAFARGLVLDYVALVNEDQGLGWPGGWRAAQEQGARAFHRAGALGHRRGFAMEAALLDEDFGRR